MTEWWYGNDKVGWCRTRHQAIGRITKYKRRSAAVDGIYPHDMKRRLEHFIGQINARKAKVVMNQ